MFQWTSPSVQGYPISSLIAVSLMRHIATHTAMMIVKGRYVKVNAQYAALPHETLKGPVYEPPPLNRSRVLTPIQVNTSMHSLPHGNRLS